MTKKLLVLLVLIMSMPFLASAGEYMLRPGDVVSINVVGFSDLNYPEIVVRPDGKFSFPYIGEINAEGLSPAALSGVITDGLSKYYENPRVTLNITKFGTTRVYVLGEVNRPGLYDLEKSHNLLDAIGVANGWTKDAAKTKVFVIHKDMAGDPQRVNLLDLLKKGDTRQNCPLVEGDVVYLSENGRIDIARDIAPLLNMGWFVKHWTDHNL